MKDEHLARIEALKLTQMVGGISSPEARVKIASQFEQYILNGLPGEAPKPSPAPDAPADDNVVPVTAAKGRRGGRTKASSEVPASTGEASEESEEGETDPSLLGRPSSRFAGVSV